MKFNDLPLAQPIHRAIADKGYHTATPIQAATIPYTIEGRDVLGCAQTGTGKTAAFALPILHRLLDSPRAKNKRGDVLPRALVLAPTRELAVQIGDSFREYGKHTKLRGTVIYGGVGQKPQVDSLRRGVDVVVACPGRLLDLINQGHCDLSAVEVFVLDEADRMLDMGFIPDIRRITSYLPDRLQTLLFSATMPKEIRKLADGMLRDPAEITIEPEKPAVDRIEQLLYHVDKPRKLTLLIELLETTSMSRAIIFTRTKHGADKVARKLSQSGIDAEAIHGNKTQGARQKALDRFKSGKTLALVATDIAARGIDVDNISHVINFDIARDAESHIHRIGRTARAGAQGVAISFCDREEIGFLKAVERLMRREITVVGDKPDYAHQHLKPQKSRAKPHTRGQHPDTPRGGKKHKPSKRRRRRRRGAANASAAGPGKPGTGVKQ